MANKRRNIQCHAPHTISMYVPGGFNLVKSAKSSTNQCKFFKSTKAKWGGKTETIEQCMHKCFQDKHCKFFSYWGNFDERNYCSTFRQCDYWGPGGNSLIRTYAREDGEHATDIVMITCGSLRVNQTVELYYQTSMKCILSLYPPPPPPFFFFLL